MLYITTSKFIADLPHNEEQTVDRAVVFCKSGESFKIEDVELLLTASVDVALEQYSTRDDMLISLGAILSSEEAVTYLDASLPVPKRFEDRISVTGKKAVKKKATRKKAAETTRVKREETPKTEKADDDANHAVPADTAPDNAAPAKEEKQQDIANAINPPVDNEPDAEKPKDVKPAAEKPKTAKKAASAPVKRAQAESTGTSPCENCVRAVKRGNFVKCQLKPSDGFKSYSEITECPDVLTID